MIRMRPFAPLLALAAACSASAQFTTAQGMYQILDENLTVVEARYDSHQQTSGPALVDHEETFVSGNSTFVGTARVSADYGAIRLFAQSVVDHRNEAYRVSDTTAEGLFFDPLTIVGGAPGDSLRATIHIEGDLMASTLSAISYGFSANVTFFVWDEATLSWANAPGQNFDFGSGPGTIEGTTTVTMTGYDPSLRYALMGFAQVSASPNGGPDLPDESVTVAVDAENTARITGIGFTRGPVGSFTGASGMVYPQAVPEPASLLGLGVGLAILRRRSRPKG